MKQLDLEKMEKIEGGFPVPSLDEQCQISGWAFAVNSGAEPGTDEFAILSGIGYYAAWMSIQ